MKNFDLIKDVNCLGNFKDRTKLFEDLISHYALEMKSCGENEFCMRTEIGTISVYLYEGEVVYSFCPSDGVQSAVVDGLGGKSHLVDRITNKVLGEINGRN